jgi:hypothetical protein
MAEENTTSKIADIEKLTHKVKDVKPFLHGRIMLCMVKIYQTTIFAMNS